MSLVQQISEWGDKVGVGTYLWRMAARQFAKRVLRRDLSARLPNNRVVTLPAWSAFSSVVWVTGGHADDGCEEVMECFADASKQFVDVGAHFGYWGVRMAHCSAGVIAVEPNPRCAPSLRAQLQRCPNPRFFGCALSDQTGELRFFADASAPHSRLLAPGEVTERAGKIIMVPLRRFDDIWREAGGLPVWGVKIDTEGHENAVLAGAEALLEAQRPLFLVETTGRDFSRIAPRFAALGYEAGWLSERHKSQRQTLGLCPVAAVESRFGSGMLFLFPAWTRGHRGWVEVRKQFSLAE